MFGLVAGAFGSLALARCEGIVLWRPGHNLFMCGPSHDFFLAIERDRN